jgi:hypothetical protein
VLGYRELARILFSTWGERIDHKTVKTLWQQSVVPTPTQLPLLDSLSRPERYQVRVQAIKLYTQGWSKVRISRFLHVSRPTVDTWIRRFETEHLAGLEDKSCTPISMRGGFGSGVCSPEEISPSGRWGG